MGPKPFYNSKINLVNAELAAKGLPTVRQTVYDVDELVDRWEETDSILERQSTSRWARAVAAEILEQHHQWADALRNIYPYNGRQCHSHPTAPPWPEELVDRYPTGWAKPNQVGSVGFWVFTDGRALRVSNWPNNVPPQQPTPIATLGQYRQVVEARLDPIVKGCQLQLSVFCLQTRRNQLFAVKRGEFICVAKACRRCMEIFAQPDPERYVQRPVGPQCSYGTGRQYPEPTIVRNVDSEDLWS